MTWTKVVQNDLHIGHELKTDHHLVFLGNANSDLGHLVDNYPDLLFLFQNQIHGSVIVEASPTPQQADGHWSTETKNALCIKTADCIPIFLANENKVCAVHAGWRGLEQKIILEACALLGVEHLKAYIGPHIGPYSFEVQMDVVEKINNSFEGLDEPEGWLLPNKKKDHYFVDLGCIAQSQLLSCGIEAVNIQAHVEDTLLSTQYHSYRRDGEKAGRQISFISIL